MYTVALEACTLTAGALRPFSSVPSIYCMCTQAGVIKFVYTIHFSASAYTAKPPMFAYTVRLPMFVYAGKPPLYAYTARLPVFAYTVLPSVFAYTARLPVLVYTLKLSVAGQVDLNSHAYASELAHWRRTEA